MAVQTVSFAAQVNDFVRQTQRRMEAVFRESAQRVVAEMQKPEGAGGHMPVDTNYLRASLQMTKGAPVPLEEKSPKGGATVAYTPDAASLVIAGAEIGETLYASYTAAYARRVNYGFEGQDSLGRTYNQPGKQFVALAAQQWPKIVTDVCSDLKTRIEARQASGGR